MSDTVKTTFQREEELPLEVRARISTYLDEAQAPWGGNEELDLLSVLGKQLPFEEAPDALGLAQMSFDAEVAQKFESVVLPRQVPGYDQMRLRALHAALAVLNTQDRSKPYHILDLGTSTGMMIRNIIAGTLATAPHRNVGDAILNNLWIEGIDIEDDMLGIARNMIQKDCSALHMSASWQKEHVELSNKDLTDDSSPLPDKEKYALITSILTIQFLLPETRPQIYKDIYDSLIPGGAFIVTEKCLGRNAREERLWTDMYYADKMRNGMSLEDVMKKRRSIERILIPLTHNSHMELLEGAGFHTQNIIRIWGDLAFEMMVAYK